MDWDLIYRDYYRGSRLNRRWYQRQGLFGRLFCTERGVKQGDPVYPTIFNIVVDAVLRGVLMEVCGPQERTSWVGMVGG